MPPKKKNDYNAVFDAYKVAHEKKLDDPKYLAAFLRMRFYAGEQHIHAGQQLPQHWQIAGGDDRIPSSVRDRCHEF